jgi:hypothetical protein
MSAQPADPRIDALYVLGLARQLLEPLHSLGQQTVGGQPTAAPVEWLGPTAYDGLDQALRGIAQAYTEIEDADGEGDALEPGTIHLQSFQDAPPRGA